MSSVVMSGSFTSDGTAKDLSLRGDFDIFEVYNQTQIATTQSTGRGCQFRWQRGMADNTGIMYTKQNSSHALDLEWLTSGGFLRVDTSVQTPEAAKTIVTDFITRANPANVSVNAHGYSNGDRVRIYNSTSMLQIAGYEFTIGNVSTNDFELSYLNSSGFAAAATAGNVRRIPNPPNYKPFKNWITNISVASSAVITLSVTHGLAVGDVVRLWVPSQFSMVEADGLTGKVTAVSTANNTITVDIDSSNFTAFSFPASASAGSPAIITVHGGNDQTAAQALTNQTEILMRLQAGTDSPAGSNNDVIYWEAKKSIYLNNE